jgi:Macrocin-O-methyltransferase (TylF)
MNDSILPIFSHVVPGIVHGRNLYDGYQRGAGLQYTDLRERIREQPDFQEAWRLVEERSICAPDRLMNIYLLIRCFLPTLAPGHIVEFGSYRGGSAMFMAKLAQKYLPGTQVYGLDTFEGMPETDKMIDGHHAGDFGDAVLEEIEAARQDSKLDNLHFIKGLFEDTCPEVIRRCGSINMVHIDCDIYHAALYAWDQVAPAMVQGGYIVFDDATEPRCLGASQAVEDIIHRTNLRSEQVYPHFVFRYPPLSDEQGNRA